MSSSTSIQERASRFMGELRAIRNRQDRGTLAALRRGLSATTVMDAWPIVARLGGDIGQPGESVFVDLAALFAMHSEESSARNFGETCRAIAFDSDKGEIIESHERRFRRLLAADSSTDLSGQLRTWVRLAASKGAGVNYESLFVHLWNWRWYADDIRVQWARSFWRARDESSIPNTLPSTEVQPSTSA